MKFALIALVAATSAFKLHHRPSGVTFFATGGDITVDENKDDLAIHGYEDVQLRFATGMNGDEDLGQNIIMKGDKYHYNQAAAQVSNDKKWVELPNCPHGDTDLSFTKDNASSATCK